MAASKARGYQQRGIGRSAICKALVALAVALSGIAANGGGNILSGARSSPGGRSLALAFIDGEASSKDAVGSVDGLDTLLLKRPALGLSGDWHLCAPEGGSCRCTGSVALHSWTAGWAMLLHVNGSIRCATDAFGDDPRPHFMKFCSCRPGPTWPLAVLDGLNATIAQRLVPRVEVGPADAGCSPEDDGAWTTCAVLSTRSDASIIPDRLLPRLPPAEQRDAAMRKLDVCHHIAGPNQALRVLGVLPGNPLASLQPIEVTAAPMCAVVYSPERGPMWDGRSVVYCPTDPRHCLETSCECANEDLNLVNIRAKPAGSDENGGEEEPDAPACWACMPPEVPEADAEAADAIEPEPQANGMRASPA